MGSKTIRQQQERMQIWNMIELMWQRSCISIFILNFYGFYGVASGLIRIFDDQESFYKQ